ncbi:molybdenum cofactor biosynthesis protein MoaE [Curtobacterium sp. MCJR17_043]|uniref:molybdenum cofactor biosynthesis protein MoaE n=1 Tax=Curtobacterium sp. MCJR17_043 TaxID=2175660 RepID=UPI0032E902A5
MPEPRTAWSSRTSSTATSRWTRSRGSSPPTTTARSSPSRGVVRDHDGGKGVTALDYERHPSAGEVIAEVARTIAEQHPEVRVAVLHRVGALGIGDVALAAAVASGHRAEAFAACGALVDLVKEQVPIWKHQRFTDGTDEWVAAL